MSGYDNTSFTTRITAATTETATVNDSIIVFTAATAKTLAVSSTTSLSGRKFVVINTAAGAVTITPSSGLINGSANLAVTASTGRAEIVFDGTNWWSITAS